MAYITFVVLSAWKKLRIRLRAIKDARVNLNSVEDLIVALIGPRPIAFSPNDDERHLRLQHARNDTAKKEDLEADLRRKQDAHKKNWYPPLMWFFVSVLYSVEFLGAVDALRKAGIDNGAYAALLTTAIFVVAAVAAKQERGTKAFYACYVCFLLVGVTAASVRFLEIAAREDASVFLSIALAALMFVITVLPPWLAEVCIRLALAGRKTARDIALTKKQLKKENQGIGAAHDEVEVINEQVVKYDHVAGLIHAEYMRHWEYESKRLASNHPPDNPTDAA